MPNYICINLIWPRINFICGLTVLKLHSFLINVTKKRDISSELIFSISVFLCIFECMPKQKIFHVFINSLLSNTCLLRYDILMCLFVHKFAIAWLDCVWQCVRMLFDMDLHFLFRTNKQLLKYSCFFFLEKTNYCHLYNRERNTRNFLTGIY